MCELMHDSMSGELRRLLVQRQQGEARQPVFAHIIASQMRQRRGKVRFGGFQEAIA